MEKGSSVNFESIVQEMLHSQSVASVCLGLATLAHHFVCPAVPSMRSVRSMALQKARTSAASSSAQPSPAVAAEEALSEEVEDEAPMTEEDEGLNQTCTVLPHSQ